MDYVAAPARRAGLFYLAAAFFYIFGMMYVEGRISVPGDVAATLQKIADTSSLYKLGFLSALLGHVCLLFVAASLYELFAPVDAGWARLILVFVVTGVAIAFLNRVHQFSVLRLAVSTEIQYSGSERRMLIPVFLDLFKDGEKLAGMFWGLWLLPAGVLAVKSGFAPKALGAGLLLACACYIASFVEYFALRPAPAGMVAPLAVYHKIETFVNVTAELGFIAWLLVAGFRRRNPASAA